MSGPNQAKTNVAMIGCGRWGRNIARVLGRLGALRVIADPAADDLRGFAAELGASVATEPESVLLRPDIDAVAIAAPAILHAELALRSLRAGKHVFVEKPLALKVDDALTSGREAKRCNRILMVGHLLQYHPAYVKLCELVGDGVIGAVRHISSTRLNRGVIRDEEDVLWSLAPHDFSMVLGLTGQAPESLEVLPSFQLGRTLADHSTVLMGFADNVTAQVQVSWLWPYKEHKLTVIGERGALVFEDSAADPERKLLHHAGYIEQLDGKARVVPTSGNPVAFSAQEPLEAELAWFIDSVQGLRIPRTGPEEAIAVLELLHRASRASRSDDRAPTA